MIQYKFVQLSQILEPKIIIDKKSEIVKFGKDNLFPAKLLELSTQSSLHTAILDKKKRMDLGKGISYDGDTDAKTDAFIEFCNPYESLNELLEKCAIDLEIFGGFCLNPIWSKDRSQIVELYHIPFQNIRSGKNNEFNQVEKYFYSEEWKSYTKPTETIEFTTFSKNNKDKKQLLYAKQYTPTNFYYPIPSYIGGINDINTLFKISEFHNQCISNNFQPGILIIFKGPIPTTEEQDAIIEALEQKYKNEAGTPAVFFLDNEQATPQIEQTQVSDLDKQYSTLTEAVKESVVMSHSIPRPVAGLETTGSLGNSKEIIEATELFLNTYIIHQQNFILRQFNKIMKINGFKEVTIANPNPSIFLYSEALLSSVLTQDEIREIFGYDPLEVTQESNTDTNKNNEITNE